MRLIDGDALVAKMNLAIAVLKRTMKNFDIGDDPECQMELKAYQDIRDGIKEEPTIEPQRKNGKWIEEQRGIIVTEYRCSECGRVVRDDTGYDVVKDYPFCHCGAKMKGEDHDEG